jgi:hypothetical protein
MTKQSDADALTDLARRTLPIVHALHAEVHGGLASPATRLSHDSNIASTIPTLPARFQHCQHDSTQTLSAPSCMLFLTRQVS